MHRQDVKSNWNATQTFWWFPRVSEAMIGRQTYQVFALFQRRAYKACSNPTSAEALHQPPFARNCSHWCFSQFACGGYQEQSDSIHIPPMSLTTHYKFKTMLVKSSYPPPTSKENRNKNTPDTPDPTYSSLALFLRHLYVNWLLTLSHFNEVIHCENII